MSTSFRKASLRFLATVMLVAFSASGCSDSSDDGDSAQREGENGDASASDASEWAQPDALPKYLDRYRQAICELTIRCGGIADPASCQSWVSQTWTDALIGAEAGRVLDPKGAAACLGSIASAPCSGEPAPSLDARDANIVRKRAFVGTLQERENCRPGQCAAGLYCTAELPNGTCPATCVAKLPEGGIAPAALACQDGLVLYKGKCSKPLAEGASCEGARAGETPCVAPAFCATEGAVCERPRQKGESCNAEARCAPGLGCASSGVCLEPTPIVYGKVGAACAQPNPPCQKDLRCATSAVSTVVTACQPYLKQDEVCVTGACGPGLFCELGALTRTCQPLPRAGQSCSTSGGCAKNDSFCDTRTVDPATGAYLCRPLVPLAGPCTEDFECASGSCDAAGTKVCVPKQPFCQNAR